MSRGAIDEDLGRRLSLAALALARDFERGGTLWCLAPQDPAHARHLAVEFVHPVIVGKRALPAVSVDAADPVPMLRASMRSGDVVACVGPPPTTIVDLFRRAAAWGVRTVLLGAGRPSGLPEADHFLWLSEGTDDGMRDGRVELLYHVLWELTHVVLEQGVPAAAEDDPAVCITCRDEGRVAEVVSIGPAGEVIARTPEGPESVDVSLIDPPAVHELLLVHAGTAIASLDNGPDPAPLA